MWGLQGGRGWDGLISQCGCRFCCGVLSADLGTYQAVVVLFNALPLASIKITHRRMLLNPFYYSKSCYVVLPCLVEGPFS